MEVVEQKITNEQKESHKKQKEVNQKDGHDDLVMFGKNYGKKFFKKY